VNRLARAQIISEWVMQMRQPLPVD